MIFPHLTAIFQCVKFVKIQHWLLVNAIAWTSSLAIIILLRIFSDPDNNLEMGSKIVLGIGLFVWQIIGTVWLFGHGK